MAFFSFAGVFPQLFTWFSAVDTSKKKKNVRERGFMLANISMRKTAKECRKIDFFIKLTFSAFSACTYRANFPTQKKAKTTKEALLQLMEVNDWIIGVSEINWGVFTWVCSDRAWPHSGPGASGGGVESFVSWPKAFNWNKWKRRRRNSRLVRRRMTKGPARRFWVKVLACEGRAEVKTTNLNGSKVRFHCRFPSYLHV